MDGSDAMRPAWAFACLAEIGHWRGGGTPSKATPEFWQGDIPWVSPKDMKSAKIEQTIDRITTQAVAGSATSLIPRNSVLIVARSGILARTIPVAINSVDVTLNQDMKAVTLHDGIEPEFIALAMMASERTILAECVKDGTTVASLDFRRFLALPVHLPPTNEQRRIVARVEALFAEIDRAEEALRRARAGLGLYRQALLKSAFEGRLTADWRAASPDKLEAPAALLARIRAERMSWHAAEDAAWRSRLAAWREAGSVGLEPSRPSRPSATTPVDEAEREALPSLPSSWTYVRLSDIAHVGSGVSVSASRIHVDPVEVPYLRVANVQRGHLDLSQMRTMRVERTQLPTLRLRPLDILFNEGGDRDKLGRGWVWEGALADCITQNHVFRATLFQPSEALAKLVSRWGNSFGRDHFEAGGKQTTNLASINKASLSALPVPLMPTDETEVLHERIEAIMSEVDQLEAETDAALARASALRQSILQSAFAGRLVAPDPSDEPASSLLARLRATPAARPARRRRRP